MKVKDLIKELQDVKDHNADISAVFEGIDIDINIVDIFNYDNEAGYVHLCLHGVLNRYGYDKEDLIETIKRDY